MPLPQPFDAEAGVVSLDQQVAQIFGNITWIVRWSKEILTDSDLNMKKAAQLYAHCASLRTGLDAFRNGNGDLTEALAALQVLWEQRAGTRPSATDVNDGLKALYTAAGAYLTFVASDYPLVDGRKVAYYVVLDTAVGKLVEDYVNIPLPAAMETRIQALRDVFV